MFARAAKSAQAKRRAGIVPDGYVNILVREVSSKAAAMIPRS